MNSQRCLYTLIHAGRERHEEILSDLVTPVARELRDNPNLDSLFFARYNDPDWQVRFRVLGRPTWIDGPVRSLMERRLEPLAKGGIIDGHEFAMYEREYERYGGEEGMALAEKLFLHDSVACLDLMEADGRGKLGKSRREVSMVLTDRFLDLLRFDRKRRFDFYQYGYSWALSMNTWQEEELRILNEKYEALKPGLLSLFFGSQAEDPVAVYGSEEAARIAARYLDSVRPVVEELLSAHAAGRVQQEIVYLAWSYTHMHCNRLGIDPTPEAILRYFMHRLMQDTAVAS